MLKSKLKTNYRRLDFFIDIDPILQSKGPFFVPFSNKRAEITIEQLPTNMDTGICVWFLFLKEFRFLLPKAEFKITTP